MRLNIRAPQSQGLECIGCKGEGVVAFLVSDAMLEGRSILAGASVQVLFQFCSRAQIYRIGYCDGNGNPRKPMQDSPTSDSALGLG